jgi:hypothetical protein
MDETNKTNQDEQKVTSGKKSGSTSKTVSLTQEEHQKLVNDASASRGRAEKVSSLEKELTRLNDELKSSTDRFNELNNRLNQAELDKVKDDPDKLKIYQTTQEATRLKAEAEAMRQEATRLKTEAEAERKQLAQDQFNFSTGYVASKYGLDVNKFEETAKGLGINEAAKLEILGQQMSGKVVQQQTTSWSPDSGVGVTNTSTVIRGDESPRDYIKKGLEERENK